MLKILYFLYEGWHNSRKGLLKLYNISKPVSNTQINKFKTNVINISAFLGKWKSVNKADSKHISSY